MDQAKKIVSDGQQPKTSEINYEVNFFFNKKTKKKFLILVFIKWIQFHSIETRRS